MDLEGEGFGTNNPPGISKALAFYYIIFKCPVYNAFDNVGLHRFWVQISHSLLFWKIHENSGSSWGLCPLDPNHDFAKTYDIFTAGVKMMDPFLFFHCFCLISGLPHENWNPSYGLEGSRVWLTFSKHFCGPFVDFEVCNIYCFWMLAEHILQRHELHVNVLGYRAELTFQCTFKCALP
jgi:hypothetical protein